MNGQLCKGFDLDLVSKFDWSKTFLTWKILEYKCWRFWNRNQHPRDTLCANFRVKRKTLNFSAQICPKMDLGLEIQKIIVGIDISILEIPYVPIFRQNGHFLVFRHKFPKKLILGSEFQKFWSGFGISTPKIPSEISVKTDNFEFFDLNLGKMPNYMRYFGSNNLEGVAESWVEVEMSWIKMGGAEWRWVELVAGGWSWVEVGARFSNTR